MQIYVYVYREKHSPGGIWLSSARVRNDDEVQAVFWFPTGSNQSVCGGGVLLLNLQRKKTLDGSIWYVFVLLSI